MIDPMPAAPNMSPDSASFHSTTPSSAASISVASILEDCLGCKWTLHVLTQVRAGIQRPGRLERSVEGLTAKVLAERLAKLVRFGILQKTAFPEVPPRVEYTLTPFGERLMDILDQIDQLQHDWDGPR